MAQHQACPNSKAIKTPQPNSCLWHAAAPKTRTEANSVTRSLSGSPTQAAVNMCSKPVSRNLPPAVVAVKVPPVLNRLVVAVNVANFPLNSHFPAPVQLALQHVLVDNALYQTLIQVLAHLVQRHHSRAGCLVLFGQKALGTKVKKFS